MIDLSTDTRAPIDEPFTTEAISVVPLRFRSAGCNELDTISGRATNEPVGTLRRSTLPELEAVEER
jgi:hypothetical protein